jgi:ABC-type bacteriocin/lantibiotic exporter with double-glycine peptidase domain
MNKHLKLILSTFTKQSHPNDCGMACLQSIFKYAGLTVPQYQPDHSKQISLLQLHKIAESAGLSSVCVKMDMDALNAATSPCILHVINATGDPHFIVHYPSKFEAGIHLIGDPDWKLELISDAALLAKWISGAALYMEDVKPRWGLMHKLYPWNAFAWFKFIPVFLCLSVPVLNVIARSSGSL